MRQSTFARAVRPRRRRRGSTVTEQRRTLHQQSPRQERSPDMRRSLRSVLALLLFVPALVCAQTTPTADEIIARYAQRIGGADRIRLIQSIRRSGRFYGGGGFEAEVTNENKR